MNVAIHCGVNRFSHKSSDKQIVASFYLEKGRKDLYHVVMLLLIKGKVHLAQIQNIIADNYSSIISQ